jgi:8-amino-7-oxononanoate synthase
VFSKELSQLKKNKLIRAIVSRSSQQGPVIKIQGRKYINFSSNDYLGLASHPAIVDSVVKSINKYAFGSGASRLLAGGSVIHKRLEKAISSFKKTESALALNSGYSANAGVMPAIAREGEVIFSDELNHASLIDGCRLSRAKTLIYRHADMIHLSGLMKKSRGRRKVVVTDTVFSMDGDIAPIREIYDICRKHGALLYLDDAHGTGVLGGGRGALAHFGIKSEPWIVQMGTFSKAFGSFGAYVAGSEDIINWITNSARSFIFSTALPSCIISASITAIRLVRRDKSFIKKLWANRGKLTEELRAVSFDTGTSESPIIPLRTRSIDDALRLSAGLFRKGIYVPAIRPPTVKEPRLRITVSAAHTEEHLETLIKALKRLRRK